MAGISITIHGLKELQDYFSRNASEAINRAVNDSLTNLANNIRGTTTALCPVDTGALQNSIDVIQTGDTVSASVGMDYASYVDEGTRFMSAQPFFTKPINDIISHFTADLENAIDQELAGAEP